MARRAVGAAQGGGRGADRSPRWRGDPQKQVNELFAALGWTEFACAADLLLNSTYVVSAWDGARLVGMARVVSDRVYISTLQQVGVHPDYQRQGLGSGLARRCVAQFAHTQFSIPDLRPRVAGELLRALRLHQNHQRDDPSTRSQPRPLILRFVCKRGVAVAAPRLLCLREVRD